MAASYNLSYSLRPEEYVPSGTANISRLRDYDFVFNYHDDINLIKHKVQLKDICYAKFHRKLYHQIPYMIHKAFENKFTIKCKCSEDKSINLLNICIRHMLDTEYQYNIPYPIFKKYIQNNLSWTNTYDGENRYVCKQCNQYYEMLNIKILKKLTGEDSVFVRNLNININNDY